MDDSRFLHLMMRYEAGLAMEDEKSALLEFFSDPANSPGIERLLVRSLAETPAAYAPDPSRWQPVIGRILGREAPKESPSGIFVRRIGWTSRKWWAAAAVFLFLLGAGWWFRLHEGRQAASPMVTREQPVQNEALPGGNKAILILAGGRQLILDSLANGEIARQAGASIQKKTGGELSYAGTSSFNRELQYNTLRTPRGGQYQLTLSDGTKVWLNAGSSITYPTFFSGKDRTVTVNGEAYFEVAKDKSRPFLVKANEMGIAVLGTRFNINAYVDEPSIRATLLEGSIKVSRESQTRILTPGQQALVKEVIRVVDDANLEQVMAWKNGLFNFNNADLGTVLRLLSRWYDVDIRYEGKVPVRKFAGELPRDLNLSQVLKILGKVGVKFIIDQKTIVVKG